MNKLPLIVYDSECQLCIRFKKSVEMLDTKKIINFISIHEEAIYLEYPGLSKDRCNEVVHLIDENKKIHEAGEVIDYLIHFFPGIRKFAWLIESESGKTALNSFYKQISKMRKNTKKGCSTCGPKGK